MTQTPVPIPHVDEDVAQNYREIKAQRGCTWADLARDMQHGDPRLAAWMRAQDAEEQKTSPASKPRGRRAPAPAATPDAPPPDAPAAPDDVVGY